MSTSCSGELKNFNIKLFANVKLFANADTAANADADANAGDSTIALPRLHPGELKRENLD